ncbi:hypothetical protein CFBP2533_44420 [Xanthomonas hortorum pv. pelargonii]|uniref:Uncharacterized protein n=4 Tax=Xanthomonas hortorum TaxID=56454 RepID=A0A6V7F9Z9_9XANT|nr:hypothetical protein CFBP2533_44420 [Xanthomonas hortorum pv. pelargonii]CAD0360250.1 hypothetical protein CFBP2533_44420 [Xanthomonas hortorum pv. pelargonii]
MPSDGWFAAMALPAQIASEIDNVRSDAANEMAVGNDLTALGYAGAPRTRARCHATAHATVMGAAVHGNAVLGGLTVWHPGATIGANAQASTVFMGPGVFYGYVDPETMTNPEFGADLHQAVSDITARPAGW